MYVQFAHYKYVQCTVNETISARTKAPYRLVHLNHNFVQFNNEQCYCFQRFCLFHPFAMECSVDRWPLKRIECVSSFFQHNQIIPMRILKPCKMFTNCFKNIRNGNGEFTEIKMYRHVHTVQSKQRTNFVCDQNRFRW